MFTGRTGGFTLLEVIIAAAMAGLLAVAMASSLHIAYRGREAATLQTEAARTAHVAIEAIARDLSCALPATGVMAGPFLGADPTQPSLTGEILELYRAVSGRALEGPWSDTIARVAYTVETVRDELSGSSSPALLRKVTRNLLSPTVPAPEVTVLARGVKALALQFFDGSLWQPTWDSSQLSNALPLLVSVAVEVEVPGPRERPGATYRLRRMVSIPCGTGATSTSSSEGGGG